MEKKKESDTWVGSKVFYKRFHVGIIEKDGQVKDTLNFKPKQMERLGHQEKQAVQSEELTPREDYTELTT